MGFNSGFKGLIFLNRDCFLTIDHITLGVAVRELSRRCGEREVVIYVRGSYFICMLCYFDYGVVRVLANRLHDK